MTRDSGPKNNARQSSSGIVAVRKIRTWIASLVFGALQKTFNLISGEWILESLAPKQNGGAIIAARSLWVAIAFFLVLQGLHVVANLLTGQEPPFDDTSTLIKWARLRLGQQRDLLLTTAAGAYIALYTRFSSQWQYLADLYNQIKAKEIDVAVVSAEAAKTDREGLDNKPDGMSSPHITPQQLLLEWKRGFVADSEHLHLSLKEPFKQVYEEWDAAYEKAQLPDAHNQ